MSEYYFLSLSLSMKKKYEAHKGFQRFEAVEFSTTEKSGDPTSPGMNGKGIVPRQRFLIIDIIDKKVPYQLQ